MLNTLHLLESAAADQVDAERVFVSAAELFGVLATPLRLRIINAICDQEKSVGDIMEAVNATGEVFLSHTKLGERYALRLAIGNLRTTRADVSAAWELLRGMATAHG